MSTGVHVLIVLAHPKPGSFTHRVLDRFMAGLADAGHTSDLADLYAEGFEPVMSPAEYGRESALRLDLPVPDDIARYHARLAAADAIAFVFPLWWSDVPAILKGWFDRVYTVGRAYLHGAAAAGQAPARLGPRLGVALVTAGHPEEHLRQTGIAGALEATLLQDRMANVGIGRQQLVLLAGTAGCTDPAHFERLLQRAYDCGRTLG